MRFFERLDWNGYRQNYIILVFTQMLNRMMIFFIRDLCGKNKTDLFRSRLVRVRY